MRVALLPFFSQQDKTTGQFLLGSCGSTKMCTFLAKQIVNDLGWHATLIRPLWSQCADRVDWGDYNQGRGLRGLVEEARMTIPPHNLYQRLHWNPEEWVDLFTNVDLLINCHEMLGYPLKHLYPKMKIIQMNVVTPEEPWPWMAPLFRECWRAVDEVVALSPSMLDYIQAYCSQHHVRLKMINTWPLSYDIDRLRRDPHATDARDIDLLFVLRGSSTNYSHHVEFMQAFQMLRRDQWLGKVAFPDVTRYLSNEQAFEKLQGPWEVLADSQSQRAYVNMLFRSKAVIALNNNMHGGMSFREAIYAGACPIALRVPGYVHLLGSDWPYFMDDAEPETIRKTVSRAFDRGLWDGVTELQRSSVIHAVARESFQRAWTDQIKPDLLSLSRS